MRYFLELAYKGNAYHGWQNQKNALSVQEVVEKILTRILGEKISITGSGRTDTGVHAEQQYVHFDTEVELNEWVYVHKLNAVLPQDISVKSIKRVRDIAHARYDATSRSYEYRINQFKNPFLYQLSYYFKPSLDLVKLNTVASLLLNHQDFECFSRVKTDVETFFCDIFRAEWGQNNEMITFYVTANRFLRGMVRAMVGTMLEVGMGRLSVEDFAKILDSKDRKKAGRAVPPEGLFLTTVTYPPDIFIK